MNVSKRITAVVILIASGWACGLPSFSSGDPSMEETRVAMAVQQTSIAIQQATLNASVGGAPTYTPYPTYTPEKGAESAPAHTPELQQSPLDISALIKASNILVYEDIVGDPALVPIVGKVLNSMSFSGGRVINTGDAMGDFRSYANSATSWDLMIVAAEDRDSFSGEMFEVMYDHIDRGGAVIIEVWYLDQVVNGKITPILRDCGVTLFRDWTRSFEYDPFNYSIYWLDSSHPLLSTPNTVSPPSYPYPNWFNDVGDLLELDAGGDAVLIGGLFPNRKNDYGTLASCIDGRMVIQTFSSHDYEQDLVEALWENYIVYTLTKHYEFTQ